MKSPDKLYLNNQAKTKALYESKFGSSLAAGEDIRCGYLVSKQKTNWLITSKASGGVTAATAVGARTASSYADSSSRGGYA